MELGVGEVGPFHSSAAPRGTPGESGAGRVAWPTRVISLDPAGARFRAFERCNPHVRAEAFQAVRGDEVDVQACVVQGLVTRELALSGQLHPGTLGAALSHRRLWMEAASGTRGMLVLEDDVVTHPSLGAWISAHHQQLLLEDITYFTVNTDSVLSTVSAQGLQETRVFVPTNPDPGWIVDALARTSLAQVRGVRLLHGFGMCCYFVSPAGAGRLLARTFPLTLEAIPVPLISPALPGLSIDRRLNAFYRELQAWVTLPFLAYTPNDDTTTQ